MANNEEQKIYIIASSKEQKEELKKDIQKLMALLSNIEFFYRPEGVGIPEERTIGEPLPKAKPKVRKKDIAKYDFWE